MSLLRHASAVAALTLASRVLGFVRDAAVAALFGAGVVGDAAVAGLAIPQIARRLLGEAALNGAIVPGLVAAERAEGAVQARAVAGATLALTVMAATGLAMLLFLFMPQAVRVLAPGFDAGGERLDGAVLVGRLAVVCLPLMAAAGVLSALANASGRMRLPAASPVVGNIAVLIVLTALAVHLADLTGQATTTGGTALGWLALASVVGAAAQLAVMVFAVSSCRLAPSRFGREALARARPILAAAAPSLLAAALPQLRFLIAGAAASGAVGGVAALFYASRLVELPLGVIGASAGAVLLPALAARVRDAEEGAPVWRGMEATLALALPAALGLAVLAGPIVTLLFGRGAFDVSAVDLTATALIFLALSLPLQAAEKILAALAFAHGHRRLATLAGLAALLVGGIAGFALSPVMGVAGPALGVLASSLAGLLGLGYGLVRHHHLSLDLSALRRARMLACATMVMTMVVAFLAHFLAETLAAGGLGGVAALAGIIAAGMAVYAAAAFRFGALDRKALSAALRRG
ncbi:lipid II flippase MurJ [Bosea sp. 117]|uniref:lipid II flippase MurJ n=1 Tax=Bosea sp. 117 TaxID=1125973 RepID=UPI0004942676|nr:lipid II flippase MurJ [Bosea sp. 117]